MRFLLTGSAGFIGYHLSSALLDAGHAVVGFDAITDYYDVRLKHDRLGHLARRPAFTRIDGRLEDNTALAAAFDLAQPDVVVHLAAQAGVRNPVSAQRTYLDANLVGTFNLLEHCRVRPPRHLLFASSSSVYGMTDGTPSAETDTTDRPVSLYAASKKAGEVMSYAYSSLYGIPTTALRFFTVYGPWGRPDMALFSFVEAIEAGRPIPLFAGGNMRRDFTYIDDTVDAVLRLIERAPTTETVPWRAINVAGGQPVPLTRFIAAIETALGRSASIDALPMQPGDVTDTSADVSRLQSLIGTVPQVPVEAGVARFVGWYRAWREGRLT